MREEWKDIAGFEGYYAVSNLGRVKSIARNVVRRNGSNYTVVEMILDPAKLEHGYSGVRLWRKGKQKCFLVHRLVATAFLPNPMNYAQVNHKDFITNNNHVDNLEWCSNRMNNTHRLVRLNKSSKYCGVYWCKIRKKWKANIRINNTRKSIGRFDSEKDAALAYEKALEHHLQNGGI